MVVVTDASLEESKRIDEICHAHQPPIVFIRAETRGVFASVFCDFGPSFTVYDVDGEQRVEYLSRQQQQWQQQQVRTAAGRQACLHNTQLQQLCCVALLEALSSSAGCCLRLLPTACTLGTAA